MRTDCTKSRAASLGFIAISSCFLFTACRSGDSFQPEQDLLEKGRQSLSTRAYSEAEQFLSRAARSKNENILLSSLSLLAQTQKQQGKLREAEKTLLQSLKLSQRIKGPESLDTQAVLAQLGAVYFSERKFKESEESWQEALNILRNSAPVDETKEMEAISGVIAASCAQGMCKDNGKLLEKLLELRRKNLGNEHPFTIISVNLMAEFYDRRNDLSAAKPLYMEVYEVNKRINPSGLPAALINLARIERKEKHYKEAERLLLEALDLEKKDNTYGSMIHPNQIATLDGLACLHVDQKNWTKAFAYSKEALAKREKVMGEKHPQIAPALKSHAEILHKLGRDKEAERLEEKARKLEIGE